MRKHRTITGFVAVAVLAVAVTGVTMRSHSPWIDGVVVSGTTLLKGFKVSHNAPAADFADRWSAMSDLPQASH
jgi:hypothetical protein